MSEAERPALDAGRPAGPARRPLRRAIGIGIVAAGAVFTLEAVWREVISGRAAVEHAFFGGLFAALATALGALPALLRHGAEPRMRDAMLGFGAGVMLAACSFSLIVPALAAARAAGAGVGGSGLQVAAALLVGAGALMALERWLPHDYFEFASPSAAGVIDARQLKRVWLFVAAVALHNVPEGLAIGTAFGGGLAEGQALAAGIAIQDVPEGMVIAMALRGVGYRPGFAVLLGALSGLVEPVAAVAGALLVVHAAMLLPWGLAFAAGAMLFVIGHEVVPESHRGGHARLATCGLILGFALMMLLDTTLG
ncbi:ZIP family metal transporter [Rubrivivax gelatinosus]|uniref:ZIP family zinc transporter n=1 Tax=Rubrivivax gelatinosus TaxID=28068 RepID=A0A4R2ME46_RUBGE|nr:ZIP family metal transporter [Rubrivivax gelatinosus]MBK1688569.1 ZIP family metal transporter [Rubrivivax gelatinosus]TCP04661.1 ZIP family zinc transporter [Rubrivivax gelatinosus]